MASHTKCSCATATTRQPWRGSCTPSLGCEVYSDGGFDQFWLTRLLDAADLPALPVQHVHALYGVACRPLLSRLRPSMVNGLAQSLVRRAEEAAALAHPLRHRAAHDAARLRTTWLHLKDLVAATDR